MRGISVCPKCGARMIEEETKGHECDIPFRFEEAAFVVRDGSGFWKRHPVPRSVIEALGDIPTELKQPHGTTDEGAEYETASFSLLPMIMYSVLNPSLS